LSFTFKFIKFEFSQTLKPFDMFESYGGNMTLM
jgi:hypothetical protein